MVTIFGLPGISFNKKQLEEMLSTFRTQLPQYYDETVTGQKFLTVVRATLNNKGKPTFEVGLEYGTEMSDLDDQIKKTELPVSGFNDPVPIAYHQEPRIQLTLPPRVQPGSLAQREGVPATAWPGARNGTMRGTFGWGFVVEEAPDNFGCYALTSWHVTDSAAPGPNRPVTFGSHQADANITDVTAEWPPGGGPPTDWDMAVARVNDVEAAPLEGQFMRCYKGHNHPYPMAFTADPLVVYSHHYMVGNKYPHCADGIFIAFSDPIGVLYPDGVTRVLHGQLEFYMLVEPGDSGSVIVQSAKPASVTGLLVAAQPKIRRAYANPLYTRGWEILPANPAAPPGLPIVDPNGDF